MGIRRKRRKRRQKTGVVLPPYARQLSMLASFTAAVGDYSTLQLHFTELVTWAAVTNRDEDHVWD